MNERIRELAIEAGIDDVLTPRDVIEKFAELIIRKCLSNMENCDGDLDFAIWKTKKDFGIEE